MTYDSGKTMAENVNDEGGRRAGPWRKAVWAAAALVLLLPLVAMQFSDEVQWSVGDFVFAGVLLFVPLGLYEFVAKKTGDPAYRTGVATALVAAVLLLWLSGAVSITDSEAEGLYFLALVVGAVGALVARFRPHGMARAMFATALALASAGVIALASGAVPAYNSAFEVLGITGVFVVLFTGSALLFREAARGTPERGAA